MISKRDGEGIADDIDFLFEVGTLRHIQRAWKQFGGIDFANVSEHTLRVAFIAVVIAKREGADVGRSVLLALFHDILELRTGDANYVQRQYRADNEELARRDLVATTSIGDLIQSLLEEYSDASSLEARVVKDADSLDCDLELIERRDAGAGIADALKKTREVVGQRLKTKTGKEIYEALERRSSHDWHLKARNRINSGDWRKNSDV